MLAPRLHLEPFLLAVSLATVAPAAGQVPFALLHSLFSPSTNAQAAAQQGYSLAVDGNITVVGAPYDDVGGQDSGQVRVYGTTTGALLHTFVNPSPAPNDNFGYAVAISGTRILVGAYRDDTGGTDAGGAYVYDLAGDAPTLPVVTLTNPSPATLDWFGQGVAISGTRVVVGAPGNDTGEFNTGIAYVFDLASATPAVPLTTLTNPSPAALDYFGFAVAISGTHVLVGAFRDGSGASAAGSAYVYDLASASPAIPVVTLTNPTPAQDDYFGYSVAISGTRVVVGAYRDDTGASDTGSAYVYDLAGATPALPVATLTNPSPAENDYFGYTVAISDLRVVIGAYLDDTGAFDAGIAYVYDFGSATPDRPVASLANPSPGPSDFFGYIVAISGTRVVVGTPLDDTGAQDAGSAYVYDLTSGTPTVPAVTLANPGPAPSDLFGSAVAISGTRVVVGAVGGFPANAYVYDLAGATPEVAAATLSHPAFIQNFGYSVAISGTRVIVGAPGSDIGAEGPGSAYVYDLASATPMLPMTTLTNSRPEMAGKFGYSVAISGAWAAVGSYRDDTGAINAGSVYVYDLASATPAVSTIILTNPSPAKDDAFGYAVAISGARVVVGAPFDDTGAFDAGSAYVYDLAGPTPAVPLFSVTNPTPSLGDREGFGWAVAISGTRVVVGAYQDITGGGGSAYVYDLASATPAVPVNTLPNPSPAFRDYFGSAVAIDGTTVVVGAYGDDSEAENSGVAYVYDLQSPTPTVPVTTLNNSTPASFDLFGNAVAISGTRVVVGAYLDDTPVRDRGAAYVFGPKPALNILPAAPGFATLSWTPSNSPGFVLQYCESFSSTNWINAPSGTANPISISATNTSRFYRLFRP